MQQNVSTIAHTFLTPGNHTVLLMTTATGNADCMGNSITKNVFVIDKPHAALKAFLACELQQVQLLDSSYTNDGLGIVSWWWDLGNGQFSTQQNPLVTYTTGGIKTVKLVVRNSKGCFSDTLIFPVNIAAKPLAKFGFSAPLCNSNIIQFSDSSTVTSATINAWNWIYNNAVFSTQQNNSHAFTNLTNTVGLFVTSSLGCKSDTVFHSFTMKTKPQVTMNFNDACRYFNVPLSAAETGTGIGISSWHWDFGDGTTSASNPVSHVYTANGNYLVKLYGISPEGCSSDTLKDTINIYGTDAFAGNDTIAAANQPIQLNATGGLSYEWSPFTGLSATDIFNPIAVNPTDQTYYLRAFTPEGCESFDTIHIKIYKGPEIYVPGGFTPNGDGNNDLLRATPVGIKTFEYFMLYNRYGQPVFKTSDYRLGWNGKLSGKDQDSGTYVWMAAAIDFRGNKIFRKGTVLLIR
jgi:gliding motility-associated-like protein